MAASVVRELDPVLKTNVVRLLGVRMSQIKGLTDADTHSLWHDRRLLLLSQL